MRKPRILISGSRENRSYYEAAVREAGGEPLSYYLPPPGIPFDGLLLAGGGDMAPFLLGQEDEGSRSIDLERDYGELALIRASLPLGKPMFGICRGHQVINIALGGTLLQDIGPKLEPFHNPMADCEDRAVYHQLCTRKGSHMARLYGPLLLTNSYHHQAITRPGEGLSVTAWSESGLIEATEHESLPILTVQFHPERMRGELQCPGLGDGQKLFTWLIETCWRFMRQE